VLRNFVQIISCILGPDHCKSERQQENGQAVENIMARALYRTLACLCVVPQIGGKRLVPHDGSMNGTLIIWNKMRADQFQQTTVYTHVLTL
jgi:hypothetical protein